MTIQVKDSGGCSLITVGNGRSDLKEAVDFSLDALYDLAWHLSLNESKAESLVLTVLRVHERHFSEDRSRGDDLRNLLVKIYLRQNQSLLGRTVGLVDELGRRVGNSARTLIKTKTRKASSPSVLSALNPEERVCLVLRERLGLPIGEIAQITGFGLQRTRRTLFSARERLRSALLER